MPSNLSKYRIARRSERPERLRPDRRARCHDGFCLDAISKQRHVAQQSTRYAPPCT